ncbi:MAG TPA: ABC transporter ATP-binding protein [Burkholderiales bacterium]|nr:ABC transporter ATP-binding protein [Burkholderiales bacterium]
MTAFVPHPALSFDAVSKRFGGVPALEGFTLDVKRGELLGLVGGNGAGKTTLIKCLLDFCAIDGGAIAISGVRHLRTEARADLAFLPERFNSPHYLTGRDFLRYMAELHRTAYSEERVKQTFERLDLSGHALDRPARTYSKGMMQKLGLAACLLSGKSLQVLDEPTSGLDPKARALLKRELQSLRADGRTVFFTSHSLSDVEQICDRMAVLDGGRLRFAGPPAELMTRYGGRDLEHAFLACIGEVVA